MAACHHSHQWSATQITTALKTVIVNLVHVVVLVLDRRYVGVLVARILVRHVVVVAINTVAIPPLGDFFSLYFLIDTC